MGRFTVRKLDHNGQQVAACPGEVIRRGEECLVLRTTWPHPQLDAGFVLLETGDRWTEHHSPADGTTSSRCVAGAAG